MLSSGGSEKASGWSMSLVPRDLSLN
ncbi:hypothetical protein Goari_006318 [Gossypium aridum]|uniref:Uncharacterized protein n=1 Tax=Gossypium aridum TaxID=34290 RepID=A0A7J8XMJ3_GOSAI|nr:hypothetical protein [Gossypium aridum]